MSEDIIGKSSEATKGGFQAIKKVEGILQSVKRVPSKFETGFGGKPSPDQAEIILTEAIILEMEPGEPEPDLQDDTFRTWMTYAQKGKEKPNVNTFFVKGFVKSGEELDAKRRGVDAKEGIWKNLIDTRVILERKSVFLFKKPKADNPEEKEEFSKVDFVFCLDEESSSASNIEEHIKKLVTGQRKPAALRALNIDSRAKQYPQYIEALKNEKLAEMLWLEVVDGVFTEKVTEEE